MGFIKRNAKRITIDAAGYFLILAAIAIGWLPGPGGIPLAVAGLGLLSINNLWAKKLRELVLKNSGRLTEILFPKIKRVEWGYDIVAVLLFILCIVLEVTHAALWQVSAGIVAFCIALAVALLNRDRINRFTRKKH